MKKGITILFLIVIVGCSRYHHNLIFDNYKPIILKHVEISSLFDKKWSISYYIIDEKVYPIEKERENDYIIFKRNNQKEEISYGKYIDGTWEYLAHGKFLMYYSDDMKIYIPVRIIELSQDKFKIDVLDMKTMGFVTVVYERI